MNLPPQLTRSASIVLCGSWNIFCRTISHFYIDVNMKKEKKYKRERERERENVICWMKPSSMVIYLYDPSRQLASYIRTIKLVEMRERRRKYFWGRMQQHLAPSKLDKKIYTTISVTNRPMKLENCSEEAPRLMAFLIGCFIIEPSKLFSAEKLLLMTPSLLHLLSSSATMHGYSSEESQFASVFPSPPIPLSLSLSLSLSKKVVEPATSIQVC